MSAPYSPAEDGVNKGVIVQRPAATGADRGGRTFIVTGLERSGTSLVAAILRKVGIFMGSDINEIVHEDEAIANILLRRDLASLVRLIRQRDTDYGTWGFKFPLLWQSLAHDDIGRFTAPHIIVTFRDPVAMAVRTSLSEYRDPVRALRAAVDEQAELGRFAERLDCPALLVSYEKALVFPHEFVGAIMTFCGLPATAILRESLVRSIEPHRRSYIAQARRRYDGVIDGIIDGCLQGWCRLTGIDDPVALDLLVNDRPVAAIRADVFRQDLKDAGFGDGRHGFRVALGHPNPGPDAIVRVRVAGQDIDLDNSGHRLAAYAITPK